MKKTLRRLLLVLLLTLLIPTAIAADQDVYIPEAEMHIQLPGNWGYVTTEMSKDPAIANLYGISTEELQSWFVNDLVCMFYPFESNHIANMYTWISNCPYSLEMLGEAHREIYRKNLEEEFRASEMEVTESFWVQLGGQYWCCVKVQFLLNGVIEKRTYLHTLQRNRVVEVSISDCEDGPGLDPVIEEVMQTVSFDLEPYTMETYPEQTPPIENYQLSSCVSLSLPKNWTVEREDDGITLNHAFARFASIVVKEKDLWTGDVQKVYANENRARINMDLFTGLEYGDVLGENIRYVGEKTFGDHNYYIYRDQVSEKTPMMYFIHLQDGMEFSFVVIGDETSAVYEELINILPSVTYNTQWLLDEKPKWEPVEEPETRNEEVFEEEPPVTVETEKNGFEIWIVILAALIATAVGVTAGFMARKKTPGIKSRICPLCGKKCGAADRFCKECGYRFPGE